MLHPDCQQGVKMVQRLGAGEGAAVKGAGRQVWVEYMEQGHQKRI